MTKNLRNKGFTAAELMVVILIIGTITAIAVPNFVSYIRSNRMAGASNELMGDLHYARSLAVAKRRQFHVEFATTEYRIVETSTSDVVRRNKMPRGVSCDASADPNFYPWGLADPVTITLDGGHGVRNFSLSTTGKVTHQ